MPYVPLTGGAYQARSLIAGAQSCINLVPEKVPQVEGEKLPVAHYPTPGLTLFGAIGSGGWRGAWRARNGALYGVVGAGLYAVVITFPGGVPTATGTLLVTIGTSAGPVSMSDNGIDLILVDGSTRGWWVALVTNAVTEISDEAFYGGDRVDLIDDWFVLNRPGTNQFYLSDALARTFDPLYIAAKGGLDDLISLTVVDRQVWLFGRDRAEIYTLSGAADFPLQIISGGIEHGCAAPHSVCRADGSAFWIERSKDGSGVILQSAGYQAKRISTHAIELALSRISNVTDAVAWTYQLRGHTVVVFTFPTGNVTWCYDLSTELWHQWQSGGGRHRGACHMAAIGPSLVGDYANGNLYQLDFDVFTDNGAAIQRVRAFPHVGGGARNRFVAFKADMECGTPGTTNNAPVSLRWSDDRGATWGAPITQNLGGTGTLTSLQFRRLGMARDRVFELSWTAPVPTALQGAWIDVEKAET